LDKCPTKIPKKQDLDKEGMGGIKVTPKENSGGNIFYWILWEFL
jgi:hypothetical protein